MTRQQTAEQIVTIAIRNVEKFKYFGTKINQNFIHEEFENGPKSGYAK